MTRIPRILLATCCLAVGAGAGVLLASRGEQVGPEPTTHGEWVAFANANGDSVRGYIAYPERQGRAPAIIVIHENRGLTDWEVSVADQYAGKGYVTLAVDLLSSRYGSTRALGDSANRMIGTLTPAGVEADLAAAYDYVASQPATAPDRIGTIGFCWGGQTVWRFAASNPRLKAAVVCYGPLPDTTMLRQVQAPVLGVYGQNDGRVNNSLPTIARTMQQLGKSFVADSYAGTGHGFLKPGRTGHGTEEAARAQRDIDAFFRARLGS
jgi:carboxymethylenebutenolidase